MALSSAQSALAGIYVKGDKEIIKNLESFTSREFVTATVFAVKKAEKVALVAAKSNAASVGSHGDVAKSLIQKTKRQSRGGVISIVGADSTYKAQRKTDAILGPLARETIG